MYISVTEAERIRRLTAKTAMTYLYVSILCIVVTNVYALYGHGVRSASMDFMFLYPLLCGTVVFLLVSLFLSRVPERLRVISRLGYNVYNSGVASLTSAGMLAGIMEIAGTGSKWVPYFNITGVALLAVGIICQAMAFVIKSKRNRE